MKSYLVDAKILLYNASLRKYKSCENNENLKPVSSQDKTFPNAKFRANPPPNSWNPGGGQKFFKRLLCLTEHLQKFLHPKSKIWISIFVKSNFSTFLVFFFLFDIYLSVLLSIKNSFLSIATKINVYFDIFYQ